MKKIIPLLLAAALLAGCVQTYDGPTEAKSVLTRTQTTYLYEESQYQRTDYAYDIYGNEVMVLEYSIRVHDEADEPYLKTRRTFDENGNITRQRQYDVSGLFPRKIVDIRYEYDDLGRMTAHLDAMEEQYSWTAVYDDDANSMTCTYPHAVSVSYFDEHGNTVRQETTFQNGETSSIIFEFRADGQRISARYDEVGGTTLYSYAYDDQGRVLTVTETKDGETREMFRYEYQDDCTIQYNFDGTHIVTAYNADGCITHKYHADSSGYVTMDTQYYYTEIQVPKEGTP